RCVPHVVHTLSLHDALPIWFEGVVTFLERRHAETDSEWSRDKYEGFMREVPCPVCEGARLKPEVLAVRVGGRSIAEVCRLPIRQDRKSTRLNSSHVKISYAV